LQATHNRRRKKSNTTNNTAIQLEGKKKKKRTHLDASVLQTIKYRNSGIVERKGMGCAGTQTS
jgi:hypothetical protein